MSGQERWQPGLQIGDYRIVKRLGAGGMGTVWGAQHIQTGALRVIKTLSGCVADGDRARFAREGVAQAALSGHPNVVTVHAAAVAAGVPYLVLEYLSGGSLEDRLARGPLPVDAAVDVTLALAEGLAHAHRSGVLHRDLKPANVMFDDEGTPKLADFGLAAMVGEASLTQTGEILGTPAYMAPEQARGDKAAIGPVTDVYGLGAILYHAVSGRPPITGGNTLLATLSKVATERPAPLRSLRPDAPPGLDTICSRALAKRPESRYPTVEAFAGDLRRLRAGEPIAAPRSRPVVRGLALGLAGALLGVGVVALGKALASDPGAAAPAPAEEPAEATAAPGDRPPTAPIPRHTDPAPADEVFPTLAQILAGPEPREYPGANRAFGLFLDGALRARTPEDKANGAFQVADALFGANGRLFVAQDRPAAARWYLRAARLGHPGAMFSLSRMLRQGEGVRIDRHASRALLRQAVAAGYTRAIRTLGYLLLDTPDVGLRYLRAAATAGDADAMEHVARCYLAGRGLERDVETGWAWFRAAADRASSSARDELAKLEPAARAATARWPEHPNLKHLLATLSQGLGHPPEELPPAPLLPDPPEPPTLAMIVAQPRRLAGFKDASPIFERHLAYAANPDAAPDQAAMSARLVGDALIGHNDLRSVARDPQEALRWYVHAALDGDPDAMIRIRWQLGLGENVAPDPTAAAALLEHAAAVGDPWAQHTLGLDLRDRGVDEGRPRDLARGIQLLTTAADADQRDALAALGEACLEGWGVPRDLARGRDLARRGADKGSRHGMNLLGRIYRDGLGVEPDVAQARRWFEAAVRERSDAAREALEELDARARDRR